MSLKRQQTVAHAQPPACLRHVCSMCLVRLLYFIPKVAVASVYLLTLTVATECFMLRNDFIAS